MSDSVKCTNCGNSFYYDTVNDYIRCTMCKVEIAVEPNLIPEEPVVETQNDKVARMEELLKEANALMLEIKEGG